MEKKIRVGVVGLGHRGRLVFEVASLFDFVEPAAACDILPRNWYEKQWLADDAFVNKFPNAVFYEDYDKMLDEANLDVVIVETGADIHAEFCCKALEKNINVLSDIPNVASLEEAEMLWKAAEKSSAIISTGSNANYSKYAFTIVDYYKKGLLGKPYCLEAEYIHTVFPGSAESVHLYENGNWRNLLIPIRYSTHSIGPFLPILEEELRYVSCFGTGMHADDYEPGFKKDDMMCAQYQTESGVTIRFMRNGRCRARIGHHNCRLFGTEGYFESMSRMGNYVFRYNSMKELDTNLKEVSGAGAPPGYENNEKAIGHGGADYAMMDYFFKAFKEGKAAISLKDGLLMTLPGIYAEESAKRGGKVLRMRYPWDEDWTTEID